MLALLGITALATPASAAPAAQLTDPVYDYATAIRETVYVETTLDNDGDGTADRVVADIVRPREAATAGREGAGHHGRLARTTSAADAATSPRRRCTPPTAR